MEFGNVLGWVVALIGVLTAVGVAFRVSRTKGTGVTIDLLERGLAVRDQALADAEKDSTKKLNELEQRCRADTARLEGRIDSLTIDFAEKLAIPVAREVAAAVVKELQRGT